jgi:signal peptidase I
MAHFLIKRAVGMGGDWFVPDRGNMRVRYAGEDKWLNENEFIKSRGMTHNVSRLMNEGEYVLLEAAAKAAAYNDLGLPVPPGLSSEGAGRIAYPDYFAYEAARLEVIRGANPHDSRYRSRLARNTLGWYIPEGSILPLGDNRDNSRDGRYFGPVRSSKILGKGSIIFWSWPELGRVGRIR